MRGLAALWVVLFHASEGGHIDRLKATLPAWLVKATFDWGHLGVAVFFVLSGFVMMHSVRGVAANEAFGPRFMARRLIRLTPPYLASIVFVVTYGVAKAFMLGQPAALPKIEVLAAHAVYLQDILAMPALSVVYWTLCIEIQFYIVFVALIVAAQRLRRLAGVGDAMLVLMGASTLVGLLWGTGWVTSPLFRGSFLPFWFAFMLGVLVSATMQDRRFAWLLTAAAGALLAGWAVEPSGVVGAALAAVSLLLLGLRVDWIARVLTTPTLQFLGLVSYTLYLIHNQLSGATAFVLAKRLPATAWGDLSLLCLILTTCMAAAWIGYRLVERPSIGWSRRIAVGTATT